MERTLNKIKTKAHPKKPHSIEGIRETLMNPNVVKDYGLNVEGDSFSYVGTVCHVGDIDDENDEDYAFTVFASKYVIDFIEEMPPEQRLYLMDGTFKSLPKEYYQLLTINIEYRNNVSI